MRHSLFMRLLSLSLFSFSLMVIQPAMANSSDWLQVKRFEEVLKKAEKGKLQAMYEVGLKYERGRGTGRNMQKAAEWYAKAAEANHAPAMARLGILYVEGNGVQRNLDRAVKLLREASRQGVASAQYQLASMYELGIGVDEDIDQAIELYSKAASGGYYQAKDKARQLTAQLKQHRKQKPVQEKRTGQTKAPEQNAPQPAKQTTASGASQDKRNLKTIAAILQGDWQHSGRPTGYLPSSISQCRGKNEDIQCISTAQERSTGRETIIYNTEATLSKFNGSEFHINYINNILEVQQQEGVRASGYDDEEAPASGGSRFKAGQQSNAHDLDCRLEKRDTITCVKDQFRTLSFTSL